MPRYYFDVWHGEHLTEDHAGKLLAGVKAAQREAQYELGEMLRRISGSATHHVLTKQFQARPPGELFEILSCRSLRA